ncbi:unnamed protein product [Prorocentrum cordatum]|uniref:Uncharacterized protein n=1 Tax=Prorocentrum cordatum TaxID=2364126 RepID=A0ABN9TCT0_9DINO|nr:unnamed protein product [Polarella glacialis]
MSGMSAAPALQDPTGRKLKPQGSNPEAPDKKAAKMDTVDTNAKQKTLDIDGEDEDNLSDDGEDEPVTMKDTCIPKTTWPKFDDGGGQGVHERSLGVGHVLYLTGSPGRDGPFDGEFFSSTFCTLVVSAFIAIFMSPSRSTITSSLFFEVMSISLDLIYMERFAAS